MSELPRARAPHSFGRVLRFLDRVVWWCLAAVAATMSLAMLVQVLCRVIFGTAIIWAEEFAVLLFAWSIFLGAAYAQKDDSHLSIDTLPLLAGPRTRTVLAILRTTVITACSLVAIWEGVGLARRALPLLYPAMDITRSFLYASVPVGFALGLIYLIANVARRVRSA
jgi:TRAP-type C4-dicarboxylate transport system permease small subunit